MGDTPSFFVIRVVKVTFLSYLCRHYSSKQDIFMKAKTTYLASKPHYEILDGLRGVAALMVIIFHLFEAISSSCFRAS